MKWLKPLTDLFKKPKVHKSNLERVTSKDPDKDRQLSRLGIPIGTPENIVKQEIKTHKFTYAQRLDIMRLIARGMTCSETREAVHEITGRYISDTQLAKYRTSKKWKHIIHKERELYLASLSDVPGFHKKVRLERADKIYNASMQAGNMKNAILATEHQRKEMEEKQGATPVSFVFQQYNGLSDEELQDKYTQALLKIEKHKQKFITVENTENSDGIRRVEGEAGK